MIELIRNPFTRLLVAAIAATTVFLVAQCHRTTFASAADGSPEGRANSTVVPARDSFSAAR